MGKESRRNATISSLSIQSISAKAALTGRRWPSGMCWSCREMLSVLSFSSDIEMASSSSSLSSAWDANVAQTMFASRMPEELLQKEVVRRLCAVPGTSSSKSDGKVKQRKSNVILRLFKSNTVADAVENFAILVTLWRQYVLQWKI